ncbi:hypothetical protein ACWCQV_43985, partial [Streptomyces eurythermus]
MAWSRVTVRVAAVPWVFGPGRPAGSSAGASPVRVQYGRSASGLPLKRIYRLCATKEDLVVAV